MTHDSRNLARQEAPRRRRLPWTVPTAAVLLLALLPAHAQGQCQYEITAIIEGFPCGGDNFAGLRPTAINDHGVVVGSRQPCNPLFNGRLPFTWSEETGYVGLQLPPGIADAEPLDINNHGEIVGLMDSTGPTGDRAFHYKDGVWTDLGVLPGHTQATAHAINDKGEIVGECYPLGRTAFIWRDGVMEELKVPVGPRSYARDINHESSIVGLMGEALTTTSLGFLQTGAETTEIPPVENSTSSEARSVNRHDVVTGQSFIDVKDGWVPRRSWVFENGTLTDLGLLPGMNRAIAEEINDAGQIIGNCSHAPSNANAPFIWQHGQMIDLHTLIVPAKDVLLVNRVYAINNSGQIAGVDLFEAFVLSPVDRPLGDVNIDCAVDERDLIAVLSDWGPCEKPGSTLCDIVTSETFQPPGDAVVDGVDLAVVLGNWMPQATGPPERR